MPLLSNVNKSFVVNKRRFDSEFYKPNLLALENLLLTKTTSTLRTHKINVVSGPFGSTLKSSAYKNEGIPFIRIQNLDSFFINPTELIYINEYDNSRIKSSELNIGDLVLSKVGNSIGIVSRVTSNIGICNISENNIGIKLSHLSVLDQNWFLSYFNSFFGNAQILRYISGNAQPKLNVLDVKDILVANASNELKEINSKIVNLAEEYYYDSIHLFNSINDTLLSSINLFNWQPTFKLSFVKAYSDSQHSFRIDAEHFQPKYDELINMIKSFSNGFIRLTDIIHNSLEMVEPRKNPDDDYRYIELSNINQSSGTINNVETIKGKEAPSRARMLVKENDIIISSVQGSLEKVALVTGEHNGCVASTGFFVFKPKIPETGFILSLCKSPIIFEQMNKWASGTILSAVSSKALRNILVPNVVEEKRKEIHDLVVQSIQQRKLSKQLIEIAKQGVEKAIETSETEAEFFINQELEKLGVNINGEN